jgi:hypothetical protein
MKKSYRWQISSHQTSKQTYRNLAAIKGAGKQKKRGGQTVYGQNISGQNILATKRIGDKTYRGQNVSATKRRGQNVSDT